MVALTAYPAHRGSHESKDGNERVEWALVRIEERLRRVEAATDTPPGDHAPAPLAAASGRTTAGVGTHMTHPYARWIVLPLPAGGMYYLSPDWCCNTTRAAPFLGRHDNGCDD